MVEACGARAHALVARGRRTAGSESGRSQAERRRSAARLWQSKACANVVGTDVLSRASVVMRASASVKCHVPF
jgi:hypothetical protein